MGRRSLLIDGIEDLFTDFPTVADKTFHIVGVTQINQAKALELAFVSLERSARYILLNRVGNLDHVPAGFLRHGGQNPQILGPHTTGFRGPEIVFHIHFHTSRRLFLCDDLPCRMAHAAKHGGGDDDGFTFPFWIEVRRGDAADRLTVFRRQGGRRANEGNKDRLDDSVCNFLKHGSLPTLVIRVQ